MYSTNASSGSSHDVGSDWYDHAFHKAYGRNQARVHCSLIPLLGSVFHPPPFPHAKYNLLVCRESCSHRHGRSSEEPWIPRLQPQIGTRMPGSKRWNLLVQYKACNVLMCRTEEVPTGSWLHRDLYPEILGS